MARRLFSEQQTIDAQAYAAEKRLALSRASGTTTSSFSSITAIFRFRSFGCTQKRPWSVSRHSPRSRDCLRIAKCIPWEART